MSVLVVGGAGYIGAHVSRALAVRADQVVVVDDLSTGSAVRIRDLPLIELDITTSDAVDRLSAAMREHQVDAVVHLAAKKQVAESVTRPELYFRQNVGGLVNLLEAMRLSGVPRLAFSSSAAVYGNPPEADDGPVSESVVPRPISPYGQTKLIGEWLCRDAATAWGLRWCALRYFNVVGAGANDLGDVAALNLVPLVFEALEQGRQPTIFGDDYPTPDGTCVRDYVHVADLADAHLAALDWLADRADRTSPGPHVFNVGTGTGASVLDVLTIVSEVTGIAVEPHVAIRRAGDAANLVADVARIATHLGWTSRRTLADAVESAWAARSARRASA